MRTGVILLNFGEPEHASEAEVVAFLERIFMANAPLESPSDPARVAARAAELARSRAPGLIEQYREVGGSPLNVQARAQAVALQRALERRGHEVVTYTAMQFTEPSIPEVVDAARADGVDRLLGLPVYPLCGPSTTVAALTALAAAVRATGWDVQLLELSGWHLHPDYIALRGDSIRRAAAAAGLDLGGRTHLVFSAHGTPLEYLRAGSRYDLYVDDCCRRVAVAAGAPAYTIGFQNHANRPIEWTQPDVERVIDEIEADAVVVDAISFMHEQSETLAELDRGLRERAEARGLVFRRVPIPHDDPRFAAVLADLVEAGLTGRGIVLDACRCRTAARCTNARVSR